VKSLFRQIAKSDANHYYVLLHKKFKPDWIVCTVVFYLEYTKSSPNIFP